MEDAKRNAFESSLPGVPPPPATVEKKAFVGEKGGYRRHCIIQIPAVTWLRVFQLKITMAYNWRKRVNCCVSMETRSVCWGVEKDF